MNLIDESYGKNTNNKKIIIACGIGIVILLFIIIALLAYVSILNNKKLTLTADGKNIEISNVIISKDDVLYIDIEDVTKIINNGYNYKKGSQNSEDNNRCYITNGYESTFFQVDSDQIYKVLIDSNETEYYKINAPIIKENDRIYMPLDALNVAANVSYSDKNNKININSISYLESYYNREASAAFVPDPSVLWETTYSNKKLLKNRLVITKDENDKLGIARISTTTDSKNKVTEVVTESIIDPKYTSIKYIEKYNQLIVEVEAGKGIVQLEEDNGEIKTKTIIAPQYEEIKPISEELFLISESSENTSTDNKTPDDKKGKIYKYGVINKDEDVVIPVQYSKIGINISNFTDNNLNNEYVIFDKYIPVQKDNLWGFIDTKGNIAVKLQYSSLGFVSNDPSVNVLIIPELNAFVVKKDKTFSIISTKGEALVTEDISKVYKENVEGKEQYTIIINGKKQNAVQYINNLKTKNTDNKNKDANKNTNNSNANNTNTTKTNTNTDTNSIVVKKNTTN